MDRDVVQSTSVLTVSTTISGRYLIRPASTKRPAPLLLGFHGYGENAETNMQELTSLPGADQWLLVSVQALHRFYARKTRSIVASWMTSQDRLRMIEDNIAYVDAVVTQVSREQETTSTLVCCGFSQGVGMAYRAGLRGKHRANGLIALAGDIPPELRTESNMSWPQVLVGRGRNDSFYTQEKMDKDLKTLRENDALFKSIVFDGGHDWHSDFRASAGRLLKTLL